MAAPRVLFVAALRWEVDTVLGHLTADLERDEGPGRLWRGRGRDAGLALLQTGVGSARAREALAWAAGRVAPDVVLSFGCAGALSDALAPGDLVIASAVVSEGGLARSAAPAWIERYQRAAAAGGRGARVGPLLTTAAVLATESAKRRAGAAAGALAVEMESAAVAGWAAERGVAFAGVRAILDPVAESLAGVTAMMTPDGRIRPGRLLATLARRPRLIRRLFALGLAAARCRAALVALHGSLVAGLRDSS